MRYDIIVDQRDKVHQHYPVRLTKYMTPNTMRIFLLDFAGYRRADIMIKKNRRGSMSAIFIKKANKQRRIEDRDLLDQLRGEIKMNLADYILRRICFKREGVSIFRSVGKYIII